VRELHISEVRAIQLAALSCLHDFCFENDLEYFLCAGSLLGAIRHDGYIPWDDDIDVVMPRKDYMRFISLTRTGLGRFVVRSPYHDDSNGGSVYLYNHCKIVDPRTLLIESPSTRRVESSVFLDIFPSDGLPANARMVSLVYRGARFLILANAAIDASSFRRRSARSVASWVLWSSIALLGAVLPKKFFFRRLDQFAMRRDFDSADNVGLVVGGYGEKECMPREIFEGHLLHAFEGGEFRIPVGYDAYLKRLYGDYMQLPPEGERRGHDQVVFLRDDRHL